METAITEILLQYGVMGGLLFIVLYWLVKHYLPEHERLHRAELSRIIESHSRNTARIVAAVEQNTRVLHFNSQALLVQSFIQGGVPREDAERIVERIRLYVEQNGRSAGGAGPFTGKVA